MGTFHSQFSEDRILWTIFKGKASGHCVEVGANDGVNDSNSYYFEQVGWDCVLVEPNPDLCRQIREVRSAALFECAAGEAPGTAILHVAEGAERAHGVSSLAESSSTPDRIARFGFVSRPVEVCVRTLDSILEQASAPAGIDFVSIDVEGFEQSVLRGFDLSRWQPRVLILEDNSNFTSTEVRAYLAERGYLPFRRTGVNDWYAQAADRELVTPSAQLHYGALRLTARLKSHAKKIPGVVRLNQLVRESINTLRR